MVYFSKKIYESTKSSEDFNMKIMEGFMEQLLSDIQLILIGGILMMNVYTFILFYIDKQRAIKHRYRISEKQLLLCSFLFGGIGSWLSMGIFRHKTQTLIFKLSIPIAALLSFVSIVIVLFYLT